MERTSSVAKEEAIVPQDALTMQKILRSMVRNPKENHVHLRCTRWFVLRHSRPCRLEKKKERDSLFAILFFCARRGTRSYVRA